MRRARRFDGCSRGSRACGPSRAMPRSEGFARAATTRWPCPGTLFLLLMRRFVFWAVVMMRPGRPARPRRQTRIEAEDEGDADAAVYAGESGEGGEEGGDLLRSRRSTRTCRSCCGTPDLACALALRLNCRCPPSRLPRWCDVGPRSCVASTTRICPIRTPLATIGSGVVLRPWGVSWPIISGVGRGLAWIALLLHLLRGRRRSSRAVRLRRRRRPG